MGARKTTYHHSKAGILVEMAEELRIKPRSKQELMERFGLSKSSVERYLRDLHLLKPNLEHQQESLTTVRRYALPTALEEMKPLEALMVHSALRLIYHHSPGYQEHYHRALEALARRLPPVARHAAERSTQELEARRGQRVTVGGSEIDLGANLERVALAWFEGRRISFEYLSPGGSGEWRRKHLSPHFVEISRSNLELYVIGHESNWHHQTMTFKLNRMRGVGFLDGPGTHAVPETFDPRTYLSSAWGVIGSSGGGEVEVCLRFAREAAYRLLEGHYPGLRVLGWTSGGTLEVCVRVGTDNKGFPLEILSWVQSWGPRLEVCSPENLRLRWLAEARAVLERGGVLDETGGPPP